MAVHALRQHFDPSQTPDVSFEINTDCNYRCPFCAQAHRPRASQHATTEAFDRVVAELRYLDFAGTLSLSVNNEPFLHPELVAFCRRATQALPRATICLATNGSLVTHDHLEAFASMLRPPVITINDYTPDHAILRRARAWLTDPRFASLPVTLQPRSRDEVLSNRAGNIPGAPPPRRTERLSVCLWPFTTLWIGPNLECFQCCSDYERTTVVGDLSRQGLMEIWHAQPLRQIREAMLAPDRGRIPLCAKCNAHWWALPRHCQSSAGSFS